MAEFSSGAEQILFTAQVFAVPCNISGKMCSAEA